jgi:large subunit ribosomal protein L17
MKHRIGFNRLDRKASHRKALMRNMMTSLFKHERIKTTKAKAKEVRRYAEKMITRAKLDSVHNRRIIAKRIWDRNVLSKLFTDIGPRFAERPGGYTRIIRLGRRYGDAAEAVFLELTDKKEPKAKKKKVRKKKVETTEETQGEEKES